jgi:predicted DCC family thiol-disulfide oxidoreductase YuxK
MTNSKRLVSLTLVAGVVYLITAIIFHALFLDQCLTELYGGRLYSVLNRVIHHRNSPTFSAYLAGAHLLFSRISLGIVFADLALAAVIGRESLRRIISAFFTTPTSPVNLAIFRMAVFGLTLAALSSDASATMWFSTFPHQLQVAPFGVGWLLPYVPISPSLVTIASTVLVVVCITGFLGIFARASSVVALILALYVMGITQIYGKVSHDHELVWFMAILAASRCGDALSVDAILASRKRADQGITDPPPDSVSYGLPLRFAALLLGIVYFFPGFWKFWTSGFDWALSDNLKFQMYSKWMEFDGWTPFFRLDWHPWLYRSMALGTIAFEMSFLLLIFFPRLRRVAAFGGVMFHVGSLFFLRIFFYDLLILYVALFDVSGTLQKFGHWLFKGRLAVLYDGDCSFCRRTIAAIRTFDVFDCIDYADARQSDTLHLPNTGNIDRSDLLQDMHAFSDKTQYRGVAAYRAMAVRIPCFWPLVPFLFSPPVEGIANKIYRSVQLHRSCSLVERKQRSSFSGTPGLASDLRVIASMGILLVAANLYSGMRGTVSGWPFACYPTFAGTMGDEIESLEIVSLTPSGSVIPTDSSTLRQSFADQRLRGLLEFALRNPGNSFERLKGVWQLYIQKDPRLKMASVVRFYRATLCTIPEKLYLNPLKRQLLVELNY